MKEVEAKVIRINDFRTIRVEVYYFHSYEKYNKKVVFSKFRLVHNQGIFPVNVGDMVLIKPANRLISRRKSWVISSAVTKG